MKPTPASCAHAAVSAKSGRGSRVTGKRGKTTDLKKGVVGRSLSRFDIAWCDIWGTYDLVLFSALKTSVQLATQANWRRKKKESVGRQLCEARGASLLGIRRPTFVHPFLFIARSLSFYIYIFLFTYKNVFIHLFVKEYESYEALQKYDLHALRLTVKRPVHSSKPPTLERRTRL